MLQPIINETNMLVFFKYIAERHRIYKKRRIQHLPPPYTKDPILQEYKFTNIFRDFDKGTKFVINFILPQCETLEEAIFNCVIYRLYNKIDTFEQVRVQKIEIFNPITFEEKLREQAKSQAVFTNAFTVSGYSWVDPTKDKISNTVTLISWVHRDIKEITKKIIDAKNSESTYKVLKEIKGIGEFLAYQIAVDLGYYSKVIFDESQFTVAGPGAKRGINRVFSDRNGWKFNKLISYTVDLQFEYFEKLDIDMEELFDDREEGQRFVNLMAMENCFCEISKYMKVFLNEKGRPRMKYKPTSELENTILSNSDLIRKEIPHTKGEHPSENNFLLCNGHCQIFKSDGSRKCKEPKLMCFWCGYIECWNCGEDWLGSLDELLPKIEGNGIAPCRNCFSFDTLIDVFENEFRNIITPKGVEF